MSEPAQRMVESNGIRLKIAEQGKGPLVLLVPALRAIQMVPGCGHWTQQERPSEVNAAIIDFVRSLPS